MTAITKFALIGGLLLVPIGAFADQAVNSSSAPRSISFPCDSGQAKAIAVKVHDDDHILFPDGFWKFVGTNQSDKNHLGIVIYQSVENPSTHLAIAAPYATKLFSYAYHGRKIGDHCQAAWPERDGDIYISILENPQLLNHGNGKLSVTCTESREPPPQYVQITGNTNGCKNNVTNVIKLYP